MDYSTELSFDDEILIVIVAIFIGFLVFMAFYINCYLPFREERDYIKMEMNRSVSENEYRYWKRALIMFYTSKIPLVRSIVGRKHKR